MSEKPENTTPSEGTQKERPERTETPPEGKPETPPVDLEAVRAQVRKEVEAEIAKKLKKITGVESIEELERKVLEEEGKWQELAERHKQEAESYRRLYEDTVKRAEITAAAVRLNAVDPEAVLALVAERAEVRDGKVFINDKDVETALRELLAEKPYLVKAAPAGSGTPAQGSGDKFAGVKSYEDLLRDSRLLAEYMRERPEEYRKLREEYFAGKAV